MKRSLRIAGTALGAFVLPACVSTQTMPPYPRASVHAPAASNRPLLTPVGTSSVAQSTSLPSGLAFADERPEATSSSVQPVGTLTVGTQPAPSDLLPVENRSTEVFAPIPTEPASSIVLPPPPMPGERRANPAPVPVPAPAPAAPVPEADGIVRPQWPVLKGGAVPLVEPPTLPKLETPAELPAAQDSKPTLDTQPKNVDVPPAALAPTPAPPPLPPGVIGSSLHHSNASPVSVGSTSKPMFLEAPAAPTEAGEDEVRLQRASGDTPLLKAVRAFEQNQPIEAAEHLKAYDPGSQQMLLALMPALVRMTEGKLAQMKAEELDIVLDQLATAPTALRARASLRANNVRLCREVHNFAHVEPFPDRHTFRPGDIVYLYMELANFSCSAESKGGFAIALSSCMELRDAANRVVWKAEPKEAADRVSTPPHDYYRNFRLCVPNVPPGTYTLAVKTTDQPTGRELNKSLEMRIGAK